MHHIRPELGSQQVKHHTRHVLRLDPVDLCFDYLLPGGETRRSFDQERLSHTSACVLFTVQSRAAGVQDTSMAPAASCPTTLAPLSHVPTAGCVCPKLRGTCATARWTTPMPGKHKHTYFIHACFSPLTCPTRVWCETCSVFIAWFDFVVELQSALWLHNKPIWKRASTLLHRNAALEQIHHIREHSGCS